MTKGDDNSDMKAERLIGERINHIAFGKGCVTRAQGENYIVADFGGVERMFEFPAAFSQYLTVENEQLRPCLPVCTPAAPRRAEPRRGRPAQKKKKSGSEGFIHDEYDTFILADIVGCTI